jgi:hypothetical protein
MVDISLTLYTKGFFGSFLKSPTQMGSLSINNSETNISRLGTFKRIEGRWKLFERVKYPPPFHCEIAKPNQIYVKQRSWADVKSTLRESAELTRWSNSMSTHFSEVVIFKGKSKRDSETRDCFCC